MRRRPRRGGRIDVVGVGVLAAAMCVATGVAAQTPAPREGTRSTAPSDAQRARYQIRMLERVLEQAVQHGTQVVAMQFRTFAPSAVLFTGATLARGFALDEYGVHDIAVLTPYRSSTPLCLRDGAPSGPRLVLTALSCTSPRHLVRNAG